MIQQEINLNLIPSSEPVVVHCNQYDEGKGRIIAHLYNGSHPYTPGANATVKVQGTKPDNHAFQYWCDISGSTVTVDVNIQMTAVAGRTPTQLIVNETSGVTGSFAFYLDVQASTLPPTIDVSETDIPILTEEAQEAARRAVQAAGTAEDAADRAESWSSNPPYIGENNNWFVYDIETEQFVDSGILARGTDGEDGERGSLWYRGTAVSGKSADPTVYPTGIADALAGDMYLNVTEGAIYHCVTGGSASVATWAYDFTLTGGGGGGGTDNYNDLINQPKIGGVTLVGNKTIGDLGGVQSFNGRSGSILPIAGDYKSSQIILSSVMHIGGETQDTVQEALEALEEHGGGGGLYPYLYIDSEAGAIVTVDAPDGSTITPTPAGSGHWECELPAYGIYVIHSVLSGQGDATYSLTVDDVKEYHITDSHYDFTIYVTADSGSTVRVSAGDEVYTGTGTGTAVAFVVHQPNTVYTIEETLDGATDSDTVTSAPTSGGSASVTVHVFEAVLNIGTTSSELRGQTITIKKGSTVVGTTAFSAQGSATFRVHEIGMYTAECTYGGDTYYSDAVSVSEETTYPMSIDIVTTPDGKTVTPTDDIQIWLACADITDKTYTTLSEVLADRDTLYRLMGNDNAVDYLVRSTAWASGITADEYAMKYIGKWNYASDTLLSDSTWCNAIGNSAYFEEVLNTKVPTMTSNTTPSGEASALNYYHSSPSYAPWRAFQDNFTLNNGWCPDTSNSWIQYEFTEQIRMLHVRYKGMTWPANVPVSIQGSNDGTFENIGTIPAIPTADNQVRDLFLPNNNAKYRCYKLSPFSVSATGYLFQFYGRQDVTEGLVDIYSAANDTVYRMVDGSPITVCTTDGTGHGVANKSNLPNGAYLLYSTVNSTSKSVTVTDGTSEIDLTS